MTRTPTLLALDPSFSATGWVVFELATDAVLAAGVIRTRAPTAAEKKQANRALLDARRGRHILMSVTELIREWNVVMAVHEVPQGRFKTATTQAAVTRAHQACEAAVHMSLGAEPVMVTVPACKKAACGRVSASKEEVEAAVRERFPAPWDALLEGVAPTKRENAYDAAAAYLAAYQEPAVAAVRAMAQRAGGGRG